jgi:GNAT superfamily N-acetyltransferase
MDGNAPNRQAGASAADSEALAALGQEVARRWRSADPLLPAPAAPAAGCHSPVIVPGPGGRPVAVGTCTHDRIPPDSMEILWGAAVRYVLTPQVGGPSVEEGLDRLLAGWRAHLCSLPGTADADTAAMVTWPSRDITGVWALLAHGLQPLTVIAARPAHRAFVPSCSGAKIRQAGPGDIAEVLALHMAEARYDVHFGGAVDRPGNAAVLRQEMERALREPGGGWRWLAEVDGRPAGLLLAESPERAAWIAPLATLAPVAYLSCLSVAPEQRGRGLGADLVSRLHAELDASGVAVTLLHHGQVNPLSAPFWYRMGYRPLWTTWEARPAAALR